MTSIIISLTNRILYSQSENHISHDTEEEDDRRKAIFAKTDHFSELKNDAGFKALEPFTFEELEELLRDLNQTGVDNGEPIIISKVNCLILLKYIIIIDILNFNICAPSQ